jgi:hypothetical protein
MFLRAQQYNYVQYDTKDGLAGSTVYDMCQDKDGFMWFATDNGLSRYDGTNFKNYTVSDGLPDNEVLKLFPDSKGRIWICCFSKEVSYLYQGKIFNKSNSELVKQITLTGMPLNLCEDGWGNVLICDYKNIYRIRTDNSIEYLNRFADFEPFRNQHLSVGSNKYFPDVSITIRESVYFIKERRLVFFTKTTKFSEKTFAVRIYKNGQFLIRNLPSTYMSRYTINSVVYLVGTTDGAWLIDTVKNVLDIHLLKGKKISNIAVDNEKNYWFSTIGEGVFKLPSFAIKNIELPLEKVLDEHEVYSLAKYNNGLIMGLSNSRSAIVAHNKIVDFIDLKRVSIGLPYVQSANNLRAICIAGGIPILGFDAFLIKMAKPFAVSRRLYAVKSVAEINKDFILVGTYNGAYKVQTKDFKKTDTLFTGRTTKVAYFDNKVYVGTLSGLYRIDSGRHLSYYSEKSSVLTRRITDIVSGPDKKIWVATSDSGVICIDSGKATHVFNVLNGLTSNICRALYVDSSYLYVGTNKGLNRISLKNINSPVIRYFKSDGLASDVINDIEKIGDSLYVASSGGVTYFNEHSISESSICNLKVLAVNSSGENVHPANKFHLNYYSNKISFEYVAISFKSSGDIEYHYNLKGLDNKWYTTRQNTVGYQLLPPGSYTFSLYAINKFGVQSSLYNFSFVVDAPFYKTRWFAFISIAIGFGAVIGYFQLRNLSLERKLNEKNKRDKLFASLEQKALQAQMNPHFIFNSLNSIQQFILTGEKEKANLYLTVFASLIRQTLYLSSKRNLTVGEEARYLTNYLEMEKMRYGGSFKYTIEGHEDKKIALLELPALFLQPFVENSLRHGIRNKPGENGIVNIRFTLVDGLLVITISDNGIGRQNASAYKSELSVEYQSKGISLAEKRMSLLNKENDREMTLEIIDKADENGNATGTEVIVKIPI